LQVAPASINGRTMVPLRFVSEELGAKVTWNGTTKQITITFNAVPLSYSTFTGAWETSKGIMVFVQSGASLTTGYNNNNIGKVSGNISGKTFKGNWYVDPVDNGTISITFSNDGKSFTGNYYIKVTNSRPGLGPATVTQTYQISGKRQ
ncbi:MAG TPA: copper amine oxidase N-terminal domain-containing protein, partial [Verrucomicrobiae bacterium]|nr:copper amine oxidase N-terminal domain-containing protein [Verrucomicrobiae bacterium]